MHLQRPCQGRVAEQPVQLCAAADVARCVADSKQPARSKAAAAKVFENTKDTKPSLGCDLIWCLVCGLGETKHI